MSSPELCIWSRTGHDVAASELGRQMTKILLVEDSKFLRMATERALARAGYDVRTAIDGPGALELARAEKPDVILLDMLLPKLTGPEVLKALKKDPMTSGMAVVAFTGLSQKNANRLRQDGACAFLDKSELALDKGCDKLLNSLAEILRGLGLEVPSPHPHEAGVGS
jgi:CheY-like chemotaxis protein